VSWFRLSIAIRREQTGGCGVRRDLIRARSWPVHTGDSMRVVRVDYAQLPQLREYRLKTGVTVTQSVEEAVSNWLQCIAPGKLENMGLETLTSPIRHSWEPRRILSPGTKR
jgi:hypothetical protein